MTNPEQNPYGYPPHKPGQTPPDAQQGVQPDGQPSQPDQQFQPPGPSLQPPGPSPEQFQPGYPGQAPQQYQPHPPHQPYPQRAPKRQLDADPGPFTWWDAGATLLYILGFMTGLISMLIYVVPGVSDLLDSGVEEDLNLAAFLGNAISYGLLGTVALVLSFGALVRSIRTFAYLWWLKLLLIPVIWVGILALNAALVIIIGEEPQTSQNQEGIVEMLGVVPFLAAFVVIGLLGPYVEEYFFRHLLIGKLSRRLNIWICAVISVASFPLLHFLPALVGAADDLTLATVLPYLTMGLAFTLAYILTGRSLLYAWLLHAFNNTMSLLVSYYVLPWAEDMEDQLEQLEQVGQILRVVLIGA